MPQSIGKIQSKLMREYYRYFSKYSKGKKSNQRVAWVTAFTPVEILDALEIAYYYPESYAAVIAASGQEQNLIKRSKTIGLSEDCCSYATCIEGCLELNEGPRGILPTPDILIATNNQCNTLPNWWNIIADRYNIPLIIIDYPGEKDEENRTYEYVTAQHKELIVKLETLSQHKLNYDNLDKKINYSKRSVEAWNKIIGSMKEYDIKPTMFFDDISFLITGRCKEDTSELYNLMYDEITNKSKNISNDIPVFWLGYPLWYHADRYPSELMDGYRIVGSNYITWWSLDYSGKDVFEKLFNAYNYTFLNLSQETRDKKLKSIIKNSGAKCAITLHNKSCKCDFVSARNIGIPQAEIEIDMIDREFLNDKIASKQLVLLKETVCTD